MRDTWYSTIAIHTQHKDITKTHQKKKNTKLQKQKEKTEEKI